MVDIAHAPAAFTTPDQRFPAGQLRFENKRLKVTVVATFEITSNEARDEIEQHVSDALSVLSQRGALRAGYEVIR